MSQEDRLRWDEKHRLAVAGSEAGIRPWLPPWITVRLPSLELATSASTPRALDVACGLGQIALALTIEHGFQVVGVDVSTVAIEAARVAAENMGANAEFLQADLDAWQPEAASFDLIIVHRFLDRLRLPVWIPEALKPGGVLIYGTFLLPLETGTPGSGPINRAYRLAAGELPTLFPSLECIELEEDAASGFVWLLARKATSVAR